MNPGGLARKLIGPPGLVLDRGNVKEADWSLTAGAQVEVVIFPGDPQCLIKAPDLVHPLTTDQDGGSVDQVSHDHLREDVSNVQADARQFGWQGRVGKVMAALKEVRRSEPTVGLIH